MRAIVLLSVLPLAGCIAHAPGSGNGGQQPIQVMVTAPVTLPASIPVSTGTASTIQFGATLTGTSNQTVTWGAPTLSSNSTATASGSGLGTITASGLYTAPSSIPSCPVSTTTPCELQVVITATSQADSTYSGQALVNIHVIIALTPPSDTIGQGAYLQLTPTITGTTDQSVNWSAICTTCASGQGGGAFDPNNNGLYIAPPFDQGVSTPQTVTVTATSAFDPTQFATAIVTVDQSDPLGTATPTTADQATITCPAFTAGLSGATCYQLSITCDQVPNTTAYLKVNSPSDSASGTVIFTTGSGSSTLYDNSPDFFYTDTNGNTQNGGQIVVQGVLNLNLNTVQVSFGSPFNSTNTENGWLQGPGGVRHLACRYATVAEWVYQNIQGSGTAYCATGNSAGASAIGYALSEFALDNIFTMAELTSGPVMTRVDMGCSPDGSNYYTGKTACTNPPNLDMSYSVGTSGTAGIIDTAYQAVGASTPTLCSDGVNGVSATNSLRFQADSIDFSPSKSPPLPISPTTLNMLFGGMDGSNAVGEGEWWWKSVGPPPTQSCEPNAGHAIPGDPSGDGAQQIITDIQTLCKAP